VGDRTRGAGRKGARRDEDPDPRRAGAHREPPVEQAGRLVGGTQGPALGVHHADHEPPSVAFRGRDEGVPGGVGEPGLAPQIAPVGRQQRVLALDLPAEGAARHARHPGGGHAQHRGRRRAGQQGTEDQRQVVGGGGLPGDVEAGRRADDGVVGADRCGGLAHRPHRDVHPAGSPGECVGGVVARLEHQRLEQQRDRIPAAGHQPDPAALDVLVLPGAHDHPVRVEQRLQGEQRQRLQRAGGVVAAVRVPGREHVAGACIGHEPAPGGETGGQRGSAGGDDDPAGGQPVAADGAAVGRGALGWAARNGSGRGRRGGIGRRPRRGGGRGGAQQHGPGGERGAEQQPDARTASSHEGRR